jgi:hypothetical protein
MGSPPGWRKLAAIARHDQFAFASQIAVEEEMASGRLPTTSGSQVDRAGIGRVLG